MEVHYRFKCAKNYESLSIERNSITVCNLKQNIFRSYQYGYGNDYDLVVINAQTNEEHLDETTLIPKDSSVLIRRLPGPPCNPIVISSPTNQEGQTGDNRHQSESRTSFLGVGQSNTNHVDVLDDDEFGEDVYHVPEVAPVNPLIPPSKVDEKQKETQHQLTTVETAKKKRKKKKERVELPMTDVAADMQWATPQDFAVPAGPLPYDPYWNSMHPGMDPYGGFIPQFMGYGPRPLIAPFGVAGMMPPLIHPHRSNLAEVEELEVGKSKTRQRHRLEGGGGSQQSYKDEVQVGNNRNVCSENLQRVDDRRHKHLRERHHAQRKQQSSKRKSCDCDEHEDGCHHRPSSSALVHHKKKRSMKSDTYYTHSRKQKMSRKDKKEESHRRHKTSSAGKERKRKRMGDYESNDGGKRRHKRRPSTYESYPASDEGDRHK